MKTTSSSFNLFHRSMMILIMAILIQVQTNVLAMSISPNNFYSSNPELWIAQMDEPCYADKTPPGVRLYKVVELNCTQVTEKPWSDFISIWDNCTSTSSLEVTYKDSVDQNCNGLGILIFRKWSVVDRAGNKTIVVQELYTNRVQLKNIEFPASVHVYCPANLDLSEEAAGAPTYLGEPVDHFCGLTVDFKDFTNVLCGNSIHIRRHWTVTDCCNLYAKNYDQDIYYHDTTRPVITCPAPITYGTNVKECYSHQLIPGITATDNCNPLQLTTTVMVDGAGAYVPGQKIILSIGNHTFKYTVADGCGNASTCTLPVTVIDGQGPLLSCSPIEVCLLTDSIRVGPNGFVYEYWDDCSGLSTVGLKIRKLEDLCGSPFDDLVFKDSVTICCAGGNSIVLVEIEAKDLAGNVSRCITEVEVTSKLPLIIECQDTVRLSCGTPVPNTPPNINYCGAFSVISKTVFDNRNGAGQGTLIKRYIVTTGTGLVDSCQTVFIIGIGANAFGADDVTCPDANVNVIGCNFPDLNSIPGIILKDTARPCAQVSVNLILDTFSNLGTPCLRIRRTWTITDALQPGFVVNCVQNINIIDTVKPVLSGVRDTTVYAGVTCNATVDLPKLVATDCDPNVVITNSLNAQGADIGPVVFPRGMTTIKYKAVDKCGNQDSLSIKVTVIDTAGFKIICQSDTIVACGATFTPRAAEVIASCTQIATNILQSDTIRNKCSIAKINFKRIVTDTSGRKDSCTFMVTFRAADTLLCNQITWPNDTTLTTCGKSIHPDSLNSKPVITFIQSNCARITTTFQDTTLAVIGVGGCTSTTRRVWTIQDTCSIPPLVCRDTQIISVIDNTAPVLTVPKDTCVYLKFQTSCDTLLSFLGSATATDCNAGVTIKNVILGRTDTAGASLVRRYGLGVTNVLVIARDICGNTAKDTVVITVKDTIKPSAACKKSNNYLNDQGFVRIHARQFDGGSVDNCTAPASLRFSWTKNIADTILEVNCTQLKILRAGGDLLLDSVKVFPFERNFILWVTDASGNQDTCVGNRFLAFFDTLNVCGKNAIRNTAALEGKVTMINGKSIPNVILSAIGEEQYQKQTGKAGDFAFDNMLPGLYKIFPYKNDDPTLGVSTSDLIAIQKHILGIERFERMDQFVAGDVNKDDDITSIDLIELRKLILGIYTQFPQNTSWRFFDKTLMARTTDHLAMAEFENPYIEAVEKQKSEQNFTGIKIGDVNQSAAPQLDNLQSRNRSAKEVTIPDVLVKAGNLVEVPFSLDITGLYGLQASIEFKGMQIVGINYNQALIDNTSSINDRMFEKGIINISWIKPYTDVRSGSQRLISIYLRPKENGKLSEFINFKNTGLTAEAYSQDRTVYDLIFKFLPAEAHQGSNLSRAIVMQNSPNPFTYSTMISYTLPAAGKVRWSVTDMTGRLIQVWENALDKGDYQVTLDKNQLKSSGIYYYKLEYNGYAEVRKMILLE